MIKLICIAIKAQTFNREAKFILKLYVVFLDVCAGYQINMLDIGLRLEMWIYDFTKLTILAHSKPGLSWHNMCRLYTT